MKALHLARRFFGSLRRGAPAPADAAWAEGVLEPGERDVWAQLPPEDRRHSVGVARRVDAALGPGVARPILAAALLHDVGKLDAALGTFGRVGATLTIAVAGRRRVEAWDHHGRGWRATTARYASHPALGARRLAAAGSDPLTVAWTAEHHLPPSRWTLAPAVAQALKAADDD